MRELRVSFLVTTGQAGKVVVVSGAGDRLRTDLIHFTSPTSAAFDPATQRLAIGTRHEVWEFQNHRALTPLLNPEHPPDAAFLPRTCHFSGDIRIHEMAWVNGEIWAANTRFSCLCTFDHVHSFVPRWRPPFISALAAEDRCHLNGIAAVDGRVRYVTCLGLTDDVGGWRRNKPAGGCVLDVDSGEPVVRGLCMPHSPRIYGGRAWLLESGRGALSVADFQTGRTEIVAKFPGFTRGLDFHGHFAFIGLSQVRETAIFSGIPIVEETTERVCGVWIMDLRTGSVVAFLQFRGSVQEVLSVVVLPGVQSPWLINEAGPELDFSYLLPEFAVAELPAKLCPR
jgi:uncharacterized protein (TIGR03032 family)